MKIKFLFALLVCGTLLFACGDGDGNGEINLAKPFLNALSETKGLKITHCPYIDGYNYNYDGPRSQTNANYTFINQTATGWDTLQTCIGIKNDKLWIGLFEVKDAKCKSVFTWTDTEEIEKTITVDNGYGNIVTYDFNGAYLNARADYVNTYAGIGFYKGNKFLGISLAYGPEREYKFIKIKDNGQLEVVSETAVNNLYFWYENTFVVGVGSNFYIQSYHLYNSNGDMLYPVYIDSNYITVSLDEAVTFNNSTYSLERVNIKTGNRVWTSTISFAGLSENARLDNYGQTKKDGNNWHYAYNYTLYSGEKVTYKFSVNIETGQITYL